jgi:hypothetical protein
MLVSLGCALPSPAGDAQSLRERYAKEGVSDIEWQMVLDARMPPEKIDEVLEAGATITEYFDYPWLEAGYTEQQWLRLRKEGLSLEERPHPDAGTGAEWAVVHNFLLPGLHQFKRRQFAKALPMTGFAVLAVGGLAFGSLTGNGRMIAGSIALWVPDALWSSIDIGVQLHREHNPEAARFAVRNTDGVGISLQLPIARR